MIIGGNTYLAVDMTVRTLTGAVVASWTIYDQEDALGFGGDAYGWLVIEEINDLAIDCSTLHPPGKTPRGKGCPVSAPTKATGGGQTAVVGGKGTFGFNAKRDGTAASGHLNYLNHVTGAHLDCNVDLITELTTTAAKFSGTCSAKSFAPSFSAEVEDNDEPGAGADKFTITYGPTEGGTIVRGNIQIH